MIRHILLMKFKTSAKSDQIESMFRQFSELKTLINDIQSIEHGENRNPEKLNKEYTHSALVTFSSALARDQYLIHPDHKKLEAVLLSLLDDLIVFDIEV